MHAPNTPFAPEPKASPATLWLVVLCTLFGAWLRLDHLGAAGLWWDEVISLDKALLPLSELWPTLAAWGTGDAGIELFPPLFHVLLHGALGISRTDQAMRLVSVVFGVLTIPAIFFLGRELFDRRAGLAAAFLLATSTYHIHYSREVRPYALFVFVNALALIALHAAVVRGRSRAWPAYALSMAAMFYTSYMASTVLAAHGLFTLLVLGPALFDKKSGTVPHPRGQALRTLGMACAAWLAVLALYAPWLPNQLVTLEALRDTPRTAGMTLEFFVTALSEFAGFTYAGPLPAGPLFALAALAGAFVAKASGRGRQLLLLGLWALMPLAGALAAKTGIDLSSRYIINVFFACLLFSGLALARLWQGLGGLLPAALNRNTWLGPAFALLGAVLLIWPNLAFLDQYYRREPARYKHALAWLQQNADDAPWLGFASGRGLALLNRWYLGQTFATLDHYRPQGYKRAFFLAPAERLQGLEAFSPRLNAREAVVFKVGLASAAPVLLTPDARGAAAYTAGLTSLAFYRDCLSADNLAPNMGGGTLALMDARRPGQAVYQFVAPPGMTLGSARLLTAFSGTFKANIACDAAVELCVSTDATHWQLLTRVDAASFAAGHAPPAGQSALTRNLALPPESAGADTLYLRISYAPVTRYGDVALTGFTLNAALAGPVPSAAQAAGQSMRQAAANNALALWRPGLTLAGGQTLFAFAQPGAAPLPDVGSPQDCEAFRLTYPGLTPVLTIPLQDGRPAYLLFDPALGTADPVDPGIALGPDQPVHALPGPELSPAVGALRLSGRFSRPAFSMGAARIDIPVEAPFDSRLWVNLGGQSRLAVSPLFNQANAPELLRLGENLKRPPGEDCLTCDKPGPCSLTLQAVSDWPVTAMRLETYPRAMADLLGKNHVRASLSLDGGPFAPVDDYRPWPSGRWEGWKMRRVQVVQLPHAARTVAVRYELSSDAAQLWSSPDAPMLLELVLDASATAPLRFQEPVVRLTADQPLRVLLLPGPIRFSDALLPDL